jgi:predicted transcriptional regulator
MADSESPDGPPPFEDAFRGDDVEQRVYGTILQTHEPTTASAIAKRADCDPKTARKYLGWFSELGIVTRHDGHPATYERNDAYFEWRRIDQLAADHSVEELQQHVRELTTRIEEYEEMYDAATPAAVDAVAAAEASDDRTIDDVYGDLGDWATAREERARYERARQQRASTEIEQVSG